MNRGWLYLDLVSALDFVTYFRLVKGRGPPQSPSVQTKIYTRINTVSIVFILTVSPLKKVLHIKPLHKSFVFGE